MSPLGRKMLQLCDNDLSIDLDLISADIFVRIKAKIAAISLGLRIKGE